MRNPFWILVGVVVQFAVGVPFWWGYSRLSTPWQVLFLLVVALIDLIRMTGNPKAKGERDYTRTVYGPVTLAGPIHPWQKEAHIG